MKPAVRNQRTEIVAAPVRIEELLNKFINDQDVKESSKSVYRRSLTQYFAWVQRTGHSLDSITRAELLEYKVSMLETGLSSLTIGSYITSVRRFYEWTEANKYYPNVAKGIKTPARKQQFRKQPLTVDQTISFINYGHTLSPRDNAILSLLPRTGQRTIEVVRANVEDIVFKGSQRVLILQGKGRDEKDNFVLLTDKAYQPIADYLATRGRVKGSDPLFASDSNNNKGGRLTTRAISFIAKEALKAIGLNDKAYTAHSLRHTTAVNILRAGGDLEKVQFTLRHSNPATSQIYTATLNEERRLKNSGEALIDSLY